jgi:hypothetical protein
MVKGIFALIIFFIFLHTAGFTQSWNFVKEKDGIRIYTRVEAGKIMAVPLPGLIPRQPDKIRIKDYKQTWSVEPAGGDMSHVVIEGYVDPAGSIPDWLTNMLIVDSPFRIICGVKQRLENK